MMIRRRAIMICNRMMMMIRRKGIMMTGHQQAPGKSCTPCFCPKVSCPTLESDTRGYFFQLQLVLSFWNVFQSLLTLMKTTLLWPKKCSVASTIEILHRTEIFPCLRVHYSPFHHQSLLKDSMPCPLLRTDPNIAFNIVCPWPHLLHISQMCWSWKWMLIQDFQFSAALSTFHIATSDPKIASYHWFTRVLCRPWEHWHLVFEYQVSLSYSGFS